MGEESRPAPKKCSFFAPEKSPSPNSSFYVIAQYKLYLQLQSLLLYHFFNFRFYGQIYHGNFHQSTVTESYLQLDKSIERPKFLQAKFPTPFSTFQCYLENSASIIACFPLYSLLFHFKLYNFLLTRINQIKLFM